MALNLIVTVTLSHPLSSAGAQSLGIAVADYPVGASLTIAREAARRLIMAGMTTISPYDAAAIEALLGTASPDDEPEVVPTFMGPEPPENPPVHYQWWQTQIGPSSQDFTLWIEDGT